MTSEAQAAIIKVAGLWAIEVAKGQHTKWEELRLALSNSFEHAYNDLSDIVAKRSANS